MRWFSEIFDEKKHSPMSRLFKIGHEVNPQTLEIDTTYTLLLSRPHPLPGQTEVQYFKIHARTLMMMQ